MNECKKCYVQVMCIYTAIKTSNIDLAIKHTEKLLSIFKTYKESC